MAWTRMMCRCPAGWIAWAKWRSSTGSVSWRPDGGPLSLWWNAAYGGGLVLPRRDGTSGRETYGGGHPATDGRCRARLVGVPTDPGSAFGDSVNEQAAEDLVRFRHTRHCDPLDRGTHGAGCAMPAEHRW